MNQYWNTFGYFAWITENGVERECFDSTVFHFDYDLSNHVPVQMVYYSILIASTFTEVFYQKSLYTNY